MTALVTRFSKEDYLRAADEVASPQGTNAGDLCSMLRQAAADGQGKDMVPLETAERLKTLAREATNGWACYARRKLEHDDIYRLHRALDAINLAATPTEPTPVVTPRKRRQLWGVADGPTEPTPLKCATCGGGGYVPVDSSHDTWKPCATCRPAKPTEPTPPSVVGRCKTCKWFNAGDSHTLTHCRKGQLNKFDGSGFCHLHEAAK